jgi:hypothetical protein
MKRSTVLPMIYAQGLDSGHGNAHLNEVDKMPSRYVSSVMDVDRSFWHFLFRRE